MMKKFDISILVVSFILIILLICSLRSEWQNLVVKVSIPSTVLADITKDYQRNIYESVTFTPEDGVKIIGLVDGTCKTITGLGAFSIILLFISIINILKTHIKFIDSKLYPYFEKVALSTNVLVALFCLISFIISFKLEMTGCSGLKCQTLTLMDKNEISYDFLLTHYIITSVTTALAGFKLMVASFVIALLAIGVSVFRFREITSPSSSIDYRFLYSGESSFLDDADAADITGDGEDDTFPTQVNF